MMRTIIWFSCGAASFTCAYLLRDTDALLVYCDTGSEHPDSNRFLMDAEKLLGKKVIILKSAEYTDHFDVIEKTRYVNGVKGARCTAELKKKLRLQFQQVDDLHIFGYTADKNDRDRADRFKQTFPEVNSSFPLIEKSLTKENCLQIVNRLGLEIPMMYRLGFDNNNCIGCVKGGKYYWNQIRKHFPEQFDRMAKLERSIGHSCIKDVFLDELDPKSGRKSQEKNMSCDMLCEMAVTNSGRSES